ncbi:MAG: PIG-L family deacetylase [Bacteroidota bacterium]|nr:PIG-L family deacetylase [Candidatus Kapabacteria bacterium]MDW8075299.1 PIG-L family deacetylase [Bacteroidota bacterium]
MKNRIVRIVFGVLCMGVVAMGQPRILVVQAHPDDETACAALLFALTHYQNAIVDICVITNGEAGYRYATLAEALYHLPLTIDSIGRAHLPRIRKREMLEAAELLGVRTVYFLDERDHAYTQSMEETLREWDTAIVRHQLERIIRRGRYDLALGLLPTQTTHGGHKAATYLLLQAAARVQPQLPVLGVLGGDSLFAVAMEPFAEGVINTPPLVFDRTVSFGFNRRLTWKAIVAWNAAVHRSQGLMPLGPIANREYYWLLAPRTESARVQVEKLFRMLREKLRTELPNYPEQ